MKNVLMISIVCMILLAGITQVWGEENPVMIEGINETNDTSQNETIPVQEELVMNGSAAESAQNTSSIDFDMTSIIPNEFKVGDAQLNVQLLNKGTVPLENVFALVTGKGFSTYTVVPIEILNPGEKSYVIVTGNFKEGGEILLTVNVGNRQFYGNVTVIDPAHLDPYGFIEATSNKKDAEALQTLSSQLVELKDQYDSLQEEIVRKKNENYDLTGINLGDLKAFLREAESSIIHKDPEQANVSLILAANEYEDQKEELDRAEKIKTSWKSIIKDNAVLISTLTGAIIASFSLYELLKKKKDTLYQKIKEVKVSKDTKVVVEKKRKKKGDEKKADQVRVTVEQKDLDKKE